MRKNRSAILEAVHNTAKGLHKAEVMDQSTLQEFERLCLPQETAELHQLWQETLSDKTPGIAAEDVLDRLEHKHLAIANAARNL